MTTSPWDLKNLSWNYCLSSIMSTSLPLPSSTNPTCKSRGTLLRMLCVFSADVTSKMSSKKQKVAALHEATTWYKQLLSMHCEYSDGKHMVFLGFRPELWVIGFRVYWEEFPTYKHHDSHAIIECFLATCTSMCDCVLSCGLMLMPSMSLRALDLFWIWQVHSH